MADPSPAFTRGRSASATTRLMHLLLGTTVVLVLILVLFSWVSDADYDVGAVDAASGTVTLALTSEPPQLNSTKATDQISGRILGHVMEGLLRYGPGGELLPGVAERWEIRDLGATFYLRRNAQWSNGEPVTARDFVFSWRTVVHPDTASQYAFLQYTLKNGEAINKGAAPVESLGVQALDDYTLEVTFDRPVPYFEQLVAFPTFFPINQAFYESRKGRYGADAEDLLYNGPFRITSWVHSANLRMERNELWWNRDSIHLKVIDFRYITADNNAILNLFKDGRVAVTGIGVEHIENALERRWNLQPFSDGAVFFLEFNHRDDRLTANRNLRKALQLAWNPGEFVYRVINVPGNLPADSLFPVWLHGVNGPFRQEYPAPPLVQDLPRARQHLQLALKELSLDEPPTLVLLIGDTPKSRREAEYVQDLYSRTLGIQIRIDAQIFKQRLEKMTLGDFDIVAAGWGPDHSDPLTFGDLFASWNLNNRGRYNSPEYDRWVRVTEASLDPQERMDAFGNMQRIMHDDVTIIPQYERGALYVVDPRLTGIVRRAVGTDPDFSYARIRSPAGAAPQ